MKVLPKYQQDSFDLDVQICVTDMCRQKKNPNYLKKDLNTAGAFRRLGDLAYTARFLSVVVQDEAYRLTREFTPANAFALYRLMMRGRTVRKMLNLCPQQLEELEASYYQGTASKWV
ncbi:MAG: hypothetical protein WCL34_11555 [Methylococcaceae bacterium]|jgi:hypothetical protein